MFLLTVLYIHYLFHLSSAATPKCYDQSGGELPSSFQPCNSPINPGACCNDITGGRGDLCTSAGLCLRQAVAPGFLYQDGCTDKEWGSGCPNFCPGNSDVPMLLQQCNDKPA
ncbi:hypothetical protein B0J14DRAFT_662376 [Halenospora varia]|nr:hypothetical protein B0J14DRAFT_662376 [Halenospora varia]